MLCRICEAREVAANAAKRGQRTCNRCQKKNYRTKHPDKYKAEIARRTKRSRTKTKKLVFDHYGHQCVYCGSTENLALDHINGRNEADTKRGHQLYREIIKLDFPDNVQPTCKQCNTAKSNLLDSQFREWLDRCYNHTHKTSA
jgi:5-methylcytosine-specific restriction endonuclease McrA